MLTVEQTVHLLKLLADPNRIRLLELLADCELSVVEITQITQLPQSRVSTHLGKLREGGLLRSRHQGATTYYSRAEQNLSQESKKLIAAASGNRWDPVLENDRLRKAQALAGREQGANWPETVAGQMERHYSPGRTWEGTALGLFQLLWLGRVLDAGSGDGSIASLLADRCRSITCLDKSAKVLQAAQRRLREHSKTNFAVGDLHALPFADQTFDHVLLLHVLTYAKEPSHAVAEAGRVLKPGGSLLIVTLEEHAHLEIVAPFGHIHPGFEIFALRAMLLSAGLAVEQCSITSREKRPPHFAVVTALAHKTIHPQSPPTHAPAIEEES